MKIRDREYEKKGDRDTERGKRKEEEERKKEGKGVNHG